jgi:hypothetical protein
MLGEREVAMDLKAEFDKLRKTATEGFDQAKELAGGLAEKAVEVVQEKIGAVTGKTAGSEPIRTWNSTVVTTLEGKNAVVRLRSRWLTLLAGKTRKS